jgi:hypothetical protein
MTENIRIANTRIVVDKLCRVRAIVKLLLKFRDLGVVSGHFGFCRSIDSANFR